MTMTKQPTITDEELDLLAEGELTPEERLDLFRRLDDDPWQWKKCALAILEAQSLRKSLREGLEDQQIVQTMSGASQLSETSSRTLLTRHSDRPQSGLRLWTAAAILLVLTTGTLAGYWMGHSRASIDSPPRLASEKSPLKSNRPDPADDALQIAVQSTFSWLNVPDEKLLAVVRIGEGEDARSIPIVASPTLADQLRQIPAVSLSPQQIRQANQHGWNIIQHPQFIAIEGPAEKSKVVAVQMVRYKFAGSEAI
jgi:hypothetical protein